MEQNSSILLPLDFDTAEQAASFASRLQGDVAGFKVGLELINAAGFEIFDQIRRSAGPATKIFYDCKLHDIPNTVAGASRAISRRGVWMFNVHASGGSAMVKAAVKGAEQGAELGGHSGRPLVIAVTVLTSISQDVLKDELAVGRNVAARLAG